MADSPAFVIGGLLATAGVGTMGTDVFVGRMPDSPDANITVYDQGGASPNPVWLRDEPSFSMLIRGTKNDYNGVYNKALEAKDAILGLSDQTVGDNIYALFYLRSDITFVSYDSDNRPQFSMSWRMVVDGNVATGNRQVIA